MCQMESSQKVKSVEDLKKLFLAEASVHDHFDAQKEYAVAYSATVALLLKNGVDLSSSSKPRALAAAFALKDKELVDFLLGSSVIQLPDVVKALEFLDANRKIRQLEKRIPVLSAQDTAGPSRTNALRRLRVKAMRAKKPEALARRLKLKGRSRTRTSRADRPDEVLAYHFFF